MNVTFDFDKLCAELQLSPTSLEGQMLKMTISETISNTSTNATSENTTQNTPNITENKSKGNRCFMCNKKLALAGTMTCKCLNIFCMEHRYPFVHNCSTDDKKEYLDRLIKENPVVTGDKFARV